MRLYDVFALLADEDDVETRDVVAKRLNRQDEHQEHFNQPHAGIPRRPTTPGRKREG